MLKKKSMLIIEENIYVNIGFRYTILNFSL